MTRPEVTAEVRSVVPADGSGSHSIVVITGFPGSHPTCAQIELTLTDNEARAFAAQYHRHKAVRILIEAADVADTGKAAL